MEDALSALPWPAQLGIVGALILWNILTIRAQNQRIQKGDLIPKAAHDESMAEKDKRYAEMLALKDERTTAERSRGDEWKIAHAVSEDGRKEERVTTAQAVEGSRAIEHFLVSVVPKVADVPSSGDNDPKEATK